MDKIRSRAGRNAPYPALLSKAIEMDQGRKGRQETLNTWWERVSACRQAYQWLQKALEKVEEMSKAPGSEPHWGSLALELSKDVAEAKSINALADHGGKEVTVVPLKGKQQLWSEKLKSYNVHVKL